MANALRTLALHLVYLLSHLVPRTESLWVFGSWYGTSFSDNAKYLFLYGSSVRPDLAKCVWISRSREVVERLRGVGLAAHTQWSVAGILTALRAGVYVFDFRSAGIAYPLSGGARKVNLWHGVPLKRIERDIEDTQHPLHRGHHGPFHKRLYRRLWEPHNYERYDLVVTTGPLPAEAAGSAFGLPPNRILVAGYPRDDALFRPSWTGLAATPDELVLRTRLEDARSSGRRLLGYLPTWRDADSMRGSVRRIPLALQDLERTLERGGGNLYCKLHPNDTAVLTSEGSESRIVTVSSGIDVYQILDCFDVLITDYSSVFVDYLLLDRPLIFFPHDLDAFQRSCRTFYYDYESITPGPKAFTGRQLVTEIDRVLTDYDGEAARWREARMRIRRQMHRFVDGRSAERCFAQIHGRFGAKRAHPELLGAGERATG